MPDNSMLAPTTERWTAIPHSANAAASYVVDTSGNVIAAGLRPDHAVLIAATPDMREALRTIAQLPQHWEDGETARKSLIKAQGIAHALLASLK